MIRSRFVERIRPYALSALIATELGFILSFSNAVEASKQKAAVDISLYQLPENGRGASSVLHINLQGVPAGGIEIKLGAMTGEEMRISLQPVLAIFSTSGPAYRTPSEGQPSVPSVIPGYLPRMPTLSPSHKHKVYKQ